jgi:signal transduction histidine kinase
VKPHPIRARLRTHLILLVLVAVLPTIAFASVVVALLSAQQNREVRLNLRGTTRALTAALDERIASVLNSLAVLAVSEDFDFDNPKGMHRRMQKAVRSRAGWTAMAVISPAGQILMHTQRPLGSKLGSAKGEEFFDRAVRNKSVTVSGYRTSKTMNGPVVTIAVPVLEDKKVVYILAGSIDVAVFSKLLQAQKLPGNWSASVLGSDSRLIARNHAEEGKLGTKGRLDVGTLGDAYEDGIIDGPNRDGTPSYGAFSHSKLTGWTVVYSMPDSALKAPVAHAFRLVVAGGLVLLFTGMFLAWMLGRGVAASIKELTAAAGALGRGEPVKPVNSPVEEVEEVSVALAHAAHERNLIEESLRQSNRQAQDAIELRDTFLSVASHELKTPVTSLQLQLQLLQRKLRDYRGDAKVQEMEKPSAQMAAQIKRLTRLVEELLDVSRISSGRLEFNPEPLDLSQFLSEIAAQFEGERERTGSELIMHADGEVNGLWDPHRLAHVFTNLIGNAFKYGSGKPIEVFVKADGPDAFIIVKDQGIGIPAEHLGRIFDRFERAVAGQNYGGLGLGLWIVQRIVSALGGQIRVESNPGQGSVFTVRLPRQPDFPQTTAFLSP